MKKRQPTCHPLEYARRVFLNSAADSRVDTLRGCYEIMQEIRKLSSGTDYDSGDFAEDTLFVVNQWLQDKWAYTLTPELANGFLIRYCGSKHKSYENLFNARARQSMYAIHIRIYAEA